MHNQVKIAVTASDTPDRRKIIEAVESIDEIVVSVYDFGEHERSEMLAFNPDVIICRHDRSMQNCESLLKWLDNQAKLRKVMTLAIVDETFVQNIGTDILKRLDQLLVGMPTDAEIRRNASLLVRLVRSENEVMQSKMFNEALKVSEDKYRTIVNSLEDGYFEIDHEGQIQFLNASMERILAMSGSQVLGHTLATILEEESAGRFATLVDRVLQHRIHTKGERWEVKTLAGRYRVAELSLVPLEQPADTAIRCLARDITSINEIELEIVKKDEQFRTAINSTKEAFYMLEAVHDITEMKKVSHRIEADRNLLHTIINAIPDEIYLKDNDRRFVMVNRGVLNMLGKKSFDEVIGKRDEDLINRKHHDLVISQDQQVLESGIPLINYEGYSYSDESQTEIKRSSLISKFPYFDKDGNIVGLIGINKDITDRKRAELRIKRSLREKEVLLKEIHHRVKNNLAVISGLLFMQAENLENEDMRHVLYDSEIRIRSMAMIHEKLYHHDMYSGIEFGSYVKDLVTTIESTYKNNGCEITVNLNTPPTYIDLNRAMPCALIVNEALSNAYKHAFKDVKKGDIWIDFSQSEGTYRMLIRDNGVGLPEDYSPENASSLGMVLIHGLVRQLGSTLYIDRSKGTLLTFEFGGDEKAPW